ncbi:helix-turn-helix transcriptional regulator [Frankia sp. CH37]|nr:helix-turn-helix transcriptional regulator [Parafrankia sp. CH37]
MTRSLGGLRWCGGKLSNSLPSVYLLTVDVDFRLAFNGNVRAVSRRFRRGLPPRRRVAVTRPGQQEGSPRRRPEWDVASSIGLRVVPADDAAVLLEAVAELLVCFGYDVVVQSDVDDDAVGLLVGPGEHRPDPLDALTDREREVLALIAQGRSNRSIGDRLALTPRTVESHVRSIFTRLGLQPQRADNRRVLAVLAYLEATGHHPAS